jgi:adenosine deaminase
MNSHSKAQTNLDSNGSNFEINGMINGLEKVELHRHLEGAIRFSTLIELAKKSGISFPEDLELQKQHFLVLEPMKDLSSVLNKFWTTQSILSSQEILTRIAYEAVEDAFLEGIKILELRYAPTFIQKSHEHLSWEQIHDSICKGIELAKDLPIAVGLICIIQRNRPIEEAHRIMDFAIAHKNTFVGVDLADDEDAVPAIQFSKVFEKAQLAQMPITVHAGESASDKSPQNVIDAVHHLGASRIGHGLQIIKSKEAMELVKNKKIVLELCPTSNWLTHAISNLHKHPINELKNYGILTTVNSDDPGIFGINLSHEYRLLAKSYQFTMEDFKIANDIAAQASFISIHKKQKFWPRPIHSI